MRTGQLAAMLAGMGVVLGGAVGGAWGQTFSNPTPMTIPASGQGGRSTLYPSPITVSGVAGPISSIVVTLADFSHTFTSDVRVLLEGPGGQRVVLMAGVHGAGDADRATLRFTSEAAPSLPTISTPVVSGTFAPTAPAGIGSFPSPAPPSPYGTSLSGLIGTEANGVWRLYVQDVFASVDDGTLAGGWSVTFNRLAGQPMGTAFTYQGVLASGGAAVSGDANVRFTLCNSATLPINQSTVGAAVTRSFTGIVGGLISTEVDFGALADTAEAVWLNVEVESPPGSGFVTLTPRQPVTPVPQARVAVMAERARAADQSDLATEAVQLSPGRKTIRGEAGAGETPGVWFASPVTSPVNRAFVGLRDDENVGFFNNGWNLRLHNNGNLALGEPLTGAPPRERLTVTGNVQINTGADVGRLAFGAVDLAGAGSENDDPVFFQRVNPAPDVSELRLILGDNATSGGLDSLRIYTPIGGGGLLERIRLQSDGNAFKPGGGTWAALSDPRAKHDVEPLSGTLERLLALRGYRFEYNQDRVAAGTALPGAQIGLMADEVERVFPDWVSRDESGTRYVTERATTALMVEALRDLRAEKDEVAAKAEAAQREAEAVREENRALQRRLEALERRMEGRGG